MAVILFSRPDHDDIVAYLHYYSKQLIKDALPFLYYNYSILDYHGNENATIKIL